VTVHSWVVSEAGRAMTFTPRDEVPGQAEVIVETAGCGVCHTDLGFFYDAVPTRHKFPLTLGHEISGRVVAVGSGAERWLGEAVVVPAVIPCGECDACRAGRGRICPHQIFPGNDVHGGFGTHVRVPSRGLCRVPDLGDPAVNAAGLDLAALAVIADAVSTPYQAMLRVDVRPGDVAVWVGAGGVGGFGVQLSAALGAHAVAIDLDADRLAALGAHGLALGIQATTTDAKSIRRAVRDLMQARGTPPWRLRIFECSGQPPGQALAFGLLGPGAELAIVGYTAKPVELRLSNLMAFDAKAIGTWGCLPEHYPAVVDLAVSGRIAIEPFIERRPLGSINQMFEDLHHGRVRGRVVLVPEARA
jgi:6-hydroxycyclohex-1-ene-1-carbonyl-CoA dehydrogenase